MNPRWIAHAVALAVLVVLCRLGLWQLDRASYKQQIEADIRASRTAVPAPLPRSADELRPWRRYTLAQLDLADTQPIYLLDNRVVDGAAGYDAFTKETIGAVEYLVGLGWLAAPPTRTEIPDIRLEAARGPLTFLAAPAPSTGMNLAATTPPEPLAPAVWRIQDLAALEPEGDAPRLLVLLAEQPLLAGARYHAPEIRFTEAKHRAYAAQWFIMAAVFCVLYYRLQRTKPTRSSQ